MACRGRRSYLRSFSYLAHCIDESILLCLLVLVILAVAARAGQSFEQSGPRKSILPFQAFVHLEVISPLQVPTATEQNRH